MEEVGDEGGIGFYRSDKPKREIQKWKKLTMKRGSSGKAKRD